MPRIKKEWDYYTVSLNRPYGGYAVYGWDTYPEGSVLAGQSRKVFLDSFETMEAAQAAFPDAKWSNKWLEPQVSLNHLPSEDDPVPGGMYPDDID